MEHEHARGRGGRGAHNNGGFATATSTSQRRSQRTGSAHCHCSRRAAWCSLSHCSSQHSCGRHRRLREQPSSARRSGRCDRAAPAGSIIPFIDATACGRPAAARNHGQRAKGFAFDVLCHVHPVMSHRAALASSATAIRAAAEWSPQGPGRSSGQLPSLGWPESRQRR